LIDEWVQALRVDADLKGLPEPLVDAEHRHVAQAHQQLARPS